jgi:hypothetical protein
MASSILRGYPHPDAGRPSAWQSSLVVRCAEPRQSPGAGNVQSGSAADQSECAYRSGRWLPDAPRLHRYVVRLAARRARGRGAYAHQGPRCAACRWSSLGSTFGEFSAERTEPDPVAFRPGPPPLFEQQSRRPRRNFARARQRCCSPAGRPAARVVVRPAGGWAGGSRPRPCLPRRGVRAGQGLSCDLCHDGSPGYWARLAGVARHRRISALWPCTGRQPLRQRHPALLRLSVRRRAGDTCASFSTSASTRTSMSASCSTACSSTSPAVSAAATSTSASGSPRPHCTRQ